MTSKMLDWKIQTDLTHVKTIQNNALGGAMDCLYTVGFYNAYPRKSTTILYLIQILRFLIFFPPSYVVTKLTYSHRFLMRKYS